jgi:hypothetical protein
LYGISAAICLQIKTFCTNLPIFSQGCGILVVSYAVSNLIQNFFRFNRLHSLYQLPVLTIAVLATKNLVIFFQMLFLRNLNNFVLFFFRLASTGHVVFEYSKRVETLFERVKIFSKRQMSCT